MQFSRSSSPGMFCINGFDTMHTVCTDLRCVVCIGLSSTEFSTVNTGLDRSMFWKPRYQLSTPEGLAFHNSLSYVTYLFSESPAYQGYIVHCQTFGKIWTSRSSLKTRLYT